MTDTLVCACCRNGATHRGSDGVYRCDLHKLNGDIAPFDTSVVDALRAALREIGKVLDRRTIQHSGLCLAQQVGDPCVCGLLEIRAIVERAVGGES